MFPKGPSAWLHEVATCSLSQFRNLSFSTSLPESESRLHICSLVSSHFLPHQNDIVVFQNSLCHNSTKCCLHVAATWAGLRRNGFILCCSRLSCSGGTSWWGRKISSVFYSFQLHIFLWNAFRYSVAFKESHAPPQKTLIVSCLPCRWCVTTKTAILQAGVLSSGSSFTWAKFTGTPSLSSRQTWTVPVKVFNKLLSCLPNWAKRFINFNM